jgi:hypothetical protein
VTGWTAEVFIPYELLSPLRNVPPKAGTRWRANFYRMDYDGGKQSSWDWSRVGPSFHEYKKFGTLVFEERHPAWPDSNVRNHIGFGTVLIP